MLWNFYTFHLRLPSVYDDLPEPSLKPACQMYPETTFSISYTKNYTTGHRPFCLCENRVGVAFYVHMNHLKNTILYIMI